MQDLKPVQAEKVKDGLQQGLLRTMDQLQEKS